MHIIFESVLMLFTQNYQISLFLSKLQLARRADEHLASQQHCPRYAYATR